MLEPHTFVPQQSVGHVVPPRTTSEGDLTEQTLVLEAGLLDEPRRETTTRRSSVIYNCQGGFGVFCIKEQDGLT